MANEPTTPALVNSALVNPTTNNRPTLDFRIPRSPLPPLNPPPLIRRHTISTTLPISGPHRPLTPHHISFYTLAPNTKNRTALWASARSKWHAEVNTASVRVCSPLSDMTTQAEAYRQDQANLRALRVWGGRVHAISPGGGGRRKRHQKTLPIKRYSRTECSVWMRKAAAEGAWSRKAQQLVPEPDHDMEEINLKIDSFEKSFPPLPAPDPSAITAPSEQTNLPRPKSPRPGLKRLANFSGGSAGRTARFNGSLNLDADDDDEDEFNNGDVRDANQNTLTPGTLTAASNPCFCADSTASELRKLMQLLCFEAADIDADDYDEREELIPKVPSVRGRSNAVSEVGSSAWRKEGRR